MRAARAPPPPVRGKTRSKKDVIVGEGSFSGFGAKLRTPSVYVTKMGNTTQPQQQQQTSRSNRGKRDILTLSPCASNYKASLENPFDTGPLACIPDFPALLTRKTKYFAKGVFYTGTLGIGFITVSPEYGAINAPYDAATAFSVVSTTAAYAGNTFAAATAANTQGFNTNSDYAPNAFGLAAPLSEYRVVSAGLRVAYIGTFEHFGGLLYGLAEPNHQSLVGQGIVSIQGYNECRRLPMTREWTNVYYKPMLPTDTMYKNTFPNNTNSNVDNNNYMGFLVQSPDPTISLAISFEFYVNLEFNGRNVQGKTKSEVDPVGYAAVQNWALTSLIPSMEDRSQNNFPLGLNMSGFMDTS